MTLPARLIIADPGLIHAGGHHLSYSQAVAEAAADRLIPAIILANQDFSGLDSTGQVQALSTFQARYQNGGQPSALRRLAYGSASYLPRAVAPLIAEGLRTARRTVLRYRAAPDTLGDELATALAGLGGARDDLVLLHTVSAANLFGLIKAIDPDSIGHLAVVLRRTPEDMDITDAAPHGMKTVLGRLVAHFGNRLHLYADTEELSLIYRMMASVPVDTVPIPVTAPPIRRAPVEALPHLVFAGGARAEKGYELLPDLIRRLRGRMRLTVQSGPIGPWTDPSVQQIHRELVHLSGPDVTLVEQLLDPADYMQLLDSTDLMLLPYRSEDYGPRSSGILAEARAMGVPAIVPARTWMASAAGPSACVVFKGPDDFIPAVERTLGCLPALTAAMRASAVSWREMHCPASLLRALLTPLGISLPNRSALLVPLCESPV